MRDGENNKRIKKVKAEMDEEMGRGRKEGKWSRK